MRQQMAVLATMVDRFEQLYGHTPMAAALHRSGVATYFVTYPGVPSKQPRRRPKSAGEKNPLTERGRARPTRPGSSSGGTTGPTTGK